jgi:hypothetical protein
MFYSQKHYIKFLQSILKGKNKKTPLWGAVYNFLLCKQLAERPTGIEPASPAWKAGVITIIRQAHKFKREYTILK